MNLPPLSDPERLIYDWQMLVEGMGEEGQRKLKGATVLISRCGGLGGPVAQELAAAGIGRLIIASGGVLLPSDLNRQILQTQAHLGRPRVESIADRLRALNPRLELVTHAANADPESALAWAREADVIVDAAPLFAERFALNAAAVALRRPMVECAMYAMEAHLTTILPGRTPCLRCLVPEAPDDWKRRFPVFGAVSGAVGCLGAMEVIKLITGLGKVLAGRMLALDLGAMEFRQYRIRRRADCPACGRLAAQ